MTDLELMQLCIDDAKKLKYPSHEGYSPNFLNNQFQAALELFRHRVRHLPGNPLQLKKEPQNVHRDPSS